MAQLSATILLGKGFHGESACVSRRPAPGSLTGELLCTTRAGEINPLPICLTVVQRPARTCCSSPLGRLYGHVLDRMECVWGEAAERQLLS